MSRRSRRDEEEEEEPGVKAWLAGEHVQSSGEAERGGDYYSGDWDNAASGSSWQEHGSAGTSGGPDEQWNQGGPPWEPAAAPWEQGGPHSAPWNQGRPPWEQTSGHPSGPLPPVSGPMPSVSSGPMPPLDPQHQPEPGWGEPADGDYPGGGFGGAGYASPGSAAGPYGGGAAGDPYGSPGPPGDPYGSAGAPGDPYGSGEGAAGYPGGGSGARSSRHGKDPYQPGDYPDPGYPGGGYAGAGYEGADYAGTGYTAAYPGGEHYAGEDAYPGHAGYPGEDDYTGNYQGGYQPEGGYTDDADLTGAGQYPAYGSGRRPADPAEAEGYGDWYGDATDAHSWADDQYEDDGVVPGLAGDTDSWNSRRPGAGRSSHSGRASARGGKGRSHKGRRSAAPWVFLIVVVLLLGMGGGGYFYYWRTYVHPPDWSGAGTGSVVVQIKSGDTAAAVGQRLVALHVVESVRAFSNAAKASGKGSTLEPGYYRLHKHMSAALAFSMLLNPKSRVQIKVTIPEGLRLSQVIAKLGKATGDLRGYQQAIKDVSALGLPSYAHGNPEGYLFPATYTIEPGTAPIKVLKEMVIRFGQEAASANLRPVAAHDQITQSQAIVVASLIQAEGRRLSDYPKIARVIYNRLNLNMKLQLDSTVLYAAHKYGIIASNAQLRIKSPYNTYLHFGLPPAPIDSPGDAALHAALHAPHAPWLYFVTVNPKTGLTKFTDSPTVFAQLRAELQKYLNQHGG